MGSFLRRVADWCVPASAMDWGHLTRGDHWIREWDQSDPWPPGEAPVIWYQRDMPAPVRDQWVSRRTPGFDLYQQYERRVRELRGW